jgi:hypothetical protein
MQVLIPTAQNAAALTSAQVRGGAANWLSPRTTAMLLDSIAQGSDENLHDTAVRVWAEVTTGLASAWTVGSIGQGAGMLIGALAGTLLGPGVGTIAGETLGGAAGELAGVAAGAAFGVDLGAKVAREIIA